MCPVPSWFPQLSFINNVNISLARAFCQLQITVWHKNSFLSLSNFLSLSKPLCLSVCLSVCLSLCRSLSLSVCLSVSVSVWSGLDWSVCLSVRLCVCRSVCLCVCLSVCVFVSLCLSVFLSVYLMSLVLCVPCFYSGLCNSCLIFAGPVLVQNGT